jgi:hypothetical protein
MGTPGKRRRRWMLSIRSRGLKGSEWEPMTWMRATSDCSWSVTQGVERGASANSRRSSIASSRREPRETELTATRDVKRPKRQGGSKKWGSESRRSDELVSPQLSTLHFEKNRISARTKLSGSV